ncbi:u3 small nucleolar ribonucleoprotein imp3 [Teratosphaeria destructans]|uniref:U3 small nucleolar ribonucleoprotein imp3 n=1 Tax=Teratosphaeria destructans TaxID=418781 RepID=A0A9W7T2F2_9PEZI|nr:u3 small nucleolar ribonucleoprotein imp3 [Teratosphaeria destructans]
MVRKFKHHEQKLLRKVDFVNYKSDGDHRAAAVIRRYSLQNPADYTSYNRLAGNLRHLAHRLALLPPDSAFRRKTEDQLLEKLNDMGLLGIGGGGKGKLSDVERKITVSAFCRRRLGVVMTRLRMAETVSAANKFIEQGHVRVGTEVITDPAFLVTRNMEDYTTWVSICSNSLFVFLRPNSYLQVDSSKIKRNIMKYRDKLDDFELL